MSREELAVCKDEHAAARQELKYAQSDYRVLVGER